MFKKILLAIGISSTPSSYASELIECERSPGGALARRCVIDQSKMLAAPIEAQKDIEQYYETDFSVDYILNCIGDRINIFLQSGSGLTQLIPDERIRNANVSGSGQLKLFDPDPQHTRRLHFNGVCKLQIENIRISPSIDTLRNWNWEAATQARLIDRSIQAHTLAKDFDNYRDWDLSKSRTFLATIDRRLIAYEAMCEAVGDNEIDEDEKDLACRTKAHFQVLRNSLQAKIDSAPLPTQPTDEVVEDIVQFFFDELVAEVNIGREMEERFEVWEIEIEENLAFILTQVPDEVR